ncbi:MAG: hypothetical protein ABGX16_13165, partial [Pirellulales bacterium]
MRVFSSWSFVLWPTVALGMVLMASVAMVHAASIEWDPRIDASTNLPVNNGNVIEAVNSAGPEIIINGITFLDGDFGDNIAHSNLLDAYADC